MNAEAIEALTSAEAGFLYAALKSGRLPASHWEVDEVSASPLAALVDGAQAKEFEEVADRLEKARCTEWAGQREPVIDEGQRRLVAQLLAKLDGGAQSRAAKYLVKRRICTVIAGLGGDISPSSAQAFDLRQWLKDDQVHLLSLRLVVLGAILVGTVNRTAIRRQLAAMVRELPESVQEQVRRGMATIGEPNRRVERRIFEVYCNIAGKDFRTDEVFALVGLFFVVSAGVFRQNKVVNRMEEALSGPLARHCRRFRQACIASGKPELSPEIAVLIRPLLRIDRESIDEDCDE